MSVDNLKNIVGIKISTEEGDKFLLPTLYTNNRHYDLDDRLSLMWMFIIAKDGCPLVSKGRIYEVLDFWEKHAIEGKTEIEEKEILKDYSSYNGFKLKGKFVSFKSYKNFIVKAVDEALTLEQIENADEEMFANEIRNYIESEFKNTFSPCISEEQLKELRNHYYPYIRKVSKAPKNWVIKFEKGFFTRRTSRQLFSTYFINEAKKMTKASAKASLKKIKESYSSYHWEMIEVKD